MKIILYYLLLLFNTGDQNYTLHIQHVEESEKRAYLVTHDRISIPLKKSLDKNSLMSCSRHGERQPTFICKHLQYGEGLGFNQPDAPFNEDWPFQNAWCDECNQVLLKEGEWNDCSEKFAGIMVICEGCFEEIKARNEKK